MRVCMRVCMPVCVRACVRAWVAAIVVEGFHQSDFPPYNPLGWNLDFSYASPQQFIKHLLKCIKQGWEMVGESFLTRLEGCCILETLGLVSDDPLRCLFREIDLKRRDRTKMIFVTINTSLLGWHIQKGICLTKGVWTKKRPARNTAGTNTEYRSRKVSPKGPDPTFKY